MVALFARVPLLASSCALLFSPALAAHQDLAEIGFAESGWDAAALGEAPPPDGLLVDLADGMSVSDVERLMRETGLVLEHSAGSADVVAGNRYEVHGSAAELERAKAILAGRDEVESVEPNVFYSLFEQPAPADDVQRPPSTKPNDPMYKHQWHFDMVNAEGAWQLTHGEGVIVAVVDTGVSPGKLKDGKKSKYRRVPDLANTEIVEGYDFVAKSADPSDGNGHGTHVAGTVAQSTNNNFGVAGLAYKAKVMPVKVLSDRGFGSVGDIANGIRFAADKGAKVINMSLGGGMYSATLARAVEYAHKKGVTVVCAAGNGGREKVEYPAAYPGCVAVSALGPDGKLAFYSSYGKELDIAAPGGDTRVDLNKDGIPDGVLQDTIARGDPTSHGFFPFQGTSMATPHVAAAAALVIAMGVTDPDRVEQVLKASARDMHDQKRFGAGGLDAAAAVKKAHKDKSFWSLGIAAALAATVVMRTRRRDSLATFKPGLGFVAALVVGASGLFFLRELGLGFLSLPVVEWPSAFFGVSSLSPLGASFLVALAPMALLLGVKKARGALAGFAFGVAGFLLARAALGMVDVAWVPGHGLLDAVWLGANGAVAAWLGALAIRR